VKGGKKSGNGLCANIGGAGQNDFAAGRGTCSLKLLFGALCLIQQDARMF